MSEHRVTPPCKDCKDRKMGCHNTASCEKWAAYMKQKSAKDEYDRERAEQHQNITEYKKDLFRKIRRRVER